MGTPIWSPKTCNPHGGDPKRIPNFGKRAGPLDGSVLYPYASYCQNSLKGVIQGIRWRFPKIGVPFLGVLIFQDYSFLGSILGFPYFGKLPDK